MVLEVGGGLGVLSEYLAPRVAHLHVVEVDRSLEPPLRDALEPFANATLHLADAVKLDLAGARAGARPRWWRTCPTAWRPRCCCKAVEELPGGDPVGGDGAARGGRAAGGRAGEQDLRRHLGARPARVRGAGAAPRAAHGLPPRAQRGVGAGACCGAPARGAAPGCRTLVHARSRTGARRWPDRWRWRPARREGVRERGPRRARGARPSAPTPAPSGWRRQDFAAPGGRARCDDRRARAGQGQPGPARGAAGARRAAPAVLAVRLARPGRRARRSRRPSADEVVCPGVEGENLAARALRGVPRGRWRPAAAAGDDRQAHAGGGRPGRGQRRRRGRAAGRQRLAGRRSATPALRGPGRRARQRRAEPGGPRPRDRDRHRRAGRAGRRCRRWRWCSCPQSAGLSSTAAVFAELDRLRPAGRAALDAGRAARARRWPARTRWPRALENDLEPAALSLRPELAGVLDAAARARARSAPSSAAPAPRRSASSATLGGARRPRAALRRRARRRCGVMPPPPQSGHRGWRSVAAVAVLYAAGVFPDLPDAKKADRGHRPGAGPVDLRAGGAARVPGDGRVRRSGGAGRDDGDRRRRDRRPGRDRADPADRARLGVLRARRHHQLLHRPPAGPRLPRAPRPARSRSPRSGSSRSSATSSATAARRS